jgi:hypothetical protein
MTMPSIPSTTSKGLRALIQELSNDEEEAAVDTMDIPTNPQWPWLHDFCAYMDVHEQVPEGWMVIQWWGVSTSVWISWQWTKKIAQYNSQCYHSAWGSLAHDYLAVMSSSISSKCAFLQGGITISKHCNCLKGDIKEALQCIKCRIQHDLLFRGPGPSSRSEEDEKEDVSRSDSGKPEESDIDELLIEDDNDKEMMDWSE